MKRKVIIQGYQGSFHEEACSKYFDENSYEVVPCSSFELLAKQLKENNEIHIGVMAIENSIAGSILQNYRIMREYNLHIAGEVYLPIRHQLMALPNQKISDLNEVWSHPMALNQCLQFLHEYPHLKLVEKEDTALSAIEIKANNLNGIAAIGSQLAATQNGLEILAKNIETNKENYTRFFVVYPERNKTDIIPTKVNKASIYLSVLHRQGSLLHALHGIDELGVNMSKLQSYPILGKPSEYMFYMDLEFDHKNQFEALIEDLEKRTTQIGVLGTYKKASVYDHITVG